MQSCTGDGGRKRPAPEIGDGTGAAAGRRRELIGGGLRELHQDGRRLREGMKKAPE